MRALIDRLFPAPPGSRTLSREVVGGVTTFAALSYILFAQTASWKTARRVVAKGNII